MTNLNIDVENKLAIPLNQLVGARVAVLGSSGSGKSNCVAVLVEETLPFMPAGTIFDIHDEYYGLQEKFQMLRVGRSAPTVEGVKLPSPPVQVEVSPLQADTFAEQVFHKKIPVIVNLAYFSEDEREEFVLNYCQRLWELNKPRRFPYWVVLEEAHNFIPQKTSTEPLDQLRQFAAEGRKFGFTVILASQRTSKVNKDILSECKFAFLHCINIENDARAYQGMLPSGFGKNQFYNLPTGGAIVKWQQDGRAQFTLTQIRKRTTYHVAQTPTAISAAPALKLQTASLDDLKLPQTVAPAAPSAANHDELIRLRAELETAHRLNYWYAIFFAHAGTSLKVAPPEPVVGEQLVIAPAHNGHTPITGDKEAQRQQKRFAALLRNIRNGAERESQVEMLKYLLQNEGDWFSIPQISRLMGYSESTMSRWQPTYLCQSPLLLLERKLEDRVWYYRAAASEVLADEYPSLETDALIEQIVEMK